MKEKKVSDSQKPVKEKKVIDKIILWRDEAAIAELKNKLGALLPFADKVVKAYHLLEFSDPQAGFYDLLSNTESRSKAHLRKVITEKITIPGVEIDTTAMINNGTYKPAGMAAYATAADQFNSAGGGNYHQYFKTESGTVKIDPAVWQKFEDSHTIAAITPAEIELYNKWKNFIDTIVDFNLYMKQYGINIHPIPLGPIYPVMVCKLDRDNKLIINPTAFATITKKIRNKIN